MLVWPCTVSRYTHGFHNYMDAQSTRNMLKCHPAATADRTAAVGSPRHSRDFRNITSTTGEKTSTRKIKFVSEGGGTTSDLRQDVASRAVSRTPRTAETDSRSDYVYGDLCLALICVSDPLNEYPHIVHLFHVSLPT